MYSIGEFAALISEVQTWRKLIYEKPNAYVGGCRTPGDGNLLSNHFFRPWNSGGTTRRAHSLKRLLFESGRDHEICLVLQGLLV
jgi:hypothetical protein